MNICNLGRTEVVLEMPQLQVYNLEINWETEKVKIIRYPLLCRRSNKKKENKKTKRKKKVATLKEKRIVRWIVDDKKDWRREEKVKTNYRRIKEMVPKKFLK